MPPKKQAAATTAVGLALPLVYRVFFLFVEPISALVGAYFAHLAQHDYLAMTDPSGIASSSSSTIAGFFSSTASKPADALPRATAVVLSQLANLYLLFALNEALVLRATSDLRVWRALLTAELVADLGHLYALRPLGAAYYWRADQWNAMALGNVPFVYLGASMRIAFLLGVGLRRGSSGSSSRTTRSTAKSKTK